MDQEGIKILVVCDHFSKWLSAWLMSSTSASKVTEYLRSCLVIFGILATLVFNNGPLFSSAELISFCTANGIMSNIPPSVIWISRQGVHIVKSIEKNRLLTETVMSHCSIVYRITGKSPVEMIYKTKPRTKLDMLKPSRSGAGQLIHFKGQTRHNIPSY
ncbi:hypothetical protein PR048_031968 [Dryococelus australis]|uniref:Integrase catalytic domain-containing protein n=1 Tax=Dryococelus australis TaxID=614101 RepID=A0ABQ9G6S7_9NEOP|nr:hypothetical protein PR048_031968 [Dryococelus australis]